MDIWLTQNEGMFELGVVLLTFVMFGFSYLMMALKQRRARGRKIKIRYNAAYVLSHQGVSKAVVSAQ